MLTSTSILAGLSTAGAVFCAGCYVYGYIIRSRGDRRFHTAGLLFSGLALGNVTVMLKRGAAPELNLWLLVTFLLLAVICQSVTALRGRRGDRRAPRAEPAQQGGSVAA